MRPLRPVFYVLLILLGLAGAALLPIPLAGYQDLRQAETKYSAGEYVDASQLYESAVRRMPWRADLWEKAAFAAYAAGKYQQAIPLFEEARQRGRLSAGGWEQLGVARWASGSRGTALAVWQEGITKYPSYPPLYNRLVAAYHVLGDYAAEQGALSLWLAVEDAPVAHYRLGLLLTVSDPNRALRELGTASSLDPEFDPAVQTLRTTLNLAALEADPAPRLVTIGRGLGLVEEWRLAAQAFSQAAESDPRDAEAWAWLGEARQHTDQDGGPDLERALSLAPNSSVVRGLRGLYWRRQGSYAQALVEYLAAAQQEPQNPSWQASMGEIYVQMGDLVAALAAYRKAAELAPRQPTYLRLLAMFCAENNIQVLEVGLPAAQKAAELAPHDPLVLDALGWSYFNAGLLYNAEQTLRRALELSPDLAAAHLHLGMTYLRKGDRAAAYDELIRARDLDPDGSIGRLAAQMLKQYFP